MVTENLDALDKKILAVLDWNGRMPATQIAKHVRSNKDVVMSRIHKLESDGVIVNYYPIIDLRRMGYYSHRLTFETEELPSEREKAFVQFLDKNIKAGLIYKMDAPYKYGAYVWTKSMYEIEEIITRIKKFLGKQLSNYHYNLLCTIRQYPKDAVFGEPMHKSKIYLGETELTEYDVQDLAILKELARNARESTIEISRRTGIPQSTVSFKIKSLERKKIILGYRADITIQKLGFEHYVVETYLGEQEEFAAFEKWANNDPHVTWLETAIGGTDIDFVLEVKNREQFEEKLNELRAKFPGIRKFFFYTERYWKLTYLPTEK